MNRTLLQVVVSLTKCCAGKGRALIVLLPEELRFLKYLKQAKVPLNEYELPLAKLSNVQVASHYCTLQSDV